MKRVYQYILITFGWSWLFWGIKYLAQEELLPSGFMLLGELAIFGPFVAFLILKKQEGDLKGSFRSLFQDETPKWSYLIAGLAPFLFSFLSFLLVVLFTDQVFELGLSFAMIVPVGLIILFVGGPIEEFGWRGFLLPKLRESYDFLISVIVIGIIHGLWHLPLHFIEGTVQINIPIWQYLIITLLGAVSYSFIYEYTKNLTPILVLHWFSNWSSAIFMYWTTNFGRYMLLIFTILLDVILIYIYYSKRKKTLSE